MGKSEKILNIGLIIVIVFSFLFYCNGLSFYKVKAVDIKTVAAAEIEKTGIKDFEIVGNENFQQGFNDVITCKVIFGDSGYGTVSFVKSLFSNGYKLDFVKMTGGESYTFVPKTQVTAFKFTPERQGNDVKINMAPETAPVLTMKIISLIIILIVYFFIRRYWKSKVDQAMKNRP